MVLPREGSDVVWGCEGGRCEGWPRVGEPNPHPKPANPRHHNHQVKYVATTTAHKVPRGGFILRRTLPDLQVPHIQSVLSLLCTHQYRHRTCAQRCVHRRRTTDPGCTAHCPWPVHTVCFTCVWNHSTEVHSLVGAPFRAPITKGAVTRARSGTPTLLITPSWARALPSTWSRGAPGPT